MRVLLELPELSYVAKLFDQHGELLWKQGRRRTLTGVRLKGLTYALAQLLRQAYPRAYLRGNKSWTFEAYGNVADEFLRDVREHLEVIRDAVDLFCDARATLIGHVRRGRGSTLNGMHIAARREAGTLIAQELERARGE